VRVSKLTNFHAIRSHPSLKNGCPEFATQDTNKKIPRYRANLFEWYIEKNPAPGKTPGKGILPFGNAPGFAQPG